MRTTLNLSADLDALVEATGEPNRGRAVDIAIKEYLRRRAIERLLDARGMFPDMEDKTAEWEEQELIAEQEHKRERGW